MKAFIVAMILLVAVSVVAAFGLETLPNSSSADSFSNPTSTRL
ncbi:MAG: hypothetical protein AAFY64_02895 [Pseudomonadota bacterium]